MTPVYNATSLVLKLNLIFIINHFLDFPARIPQPPLPIKKPNVYQKPLLLVANTAISSLNTIPISPKGAMIPCNIPHKNPQGSPVTQASTDVFSAHPDKNVRTKNAASKIYN
jgi:hypothetical protein